MLRPGRNVPHVETPLVLRRRLPNRGKKVLAILAVSMTLLYLLLVWRLFSDTSKAKKLQSDLDEMLRDRDNARDRHGRGGSTLLVASFPRVELTSSLIVTQGMDLCQVAYDDAATHGRGWGVRHCMRDASWPRLRTMRWGGLPFRCPTLVMGQLSLHPCAGAGGCVHPPHPPRFAGISQSSRHRRVPLRSIIDSTGPSQNLRLAKRGEQTAWWSR